MSYKNYVKTKHSIKLVFQNKSWIQFKKRQHNVKAKVNLRSRSNPRSISRSMSRLWSREEDFVRVSAENWLRFNN